MDDDLDLSHLFSGEPWEEIEIPDDIDPIKTILDHHEHIEERRYPPMRAAMANISQHPDYNRFYLDNLYWHDLHENNGRGAIEWGMTYDQYLRRRLNLD